MDTFVVMTVDKQAVAHKTAVMMDLTCDEANTYIQNLNIHHPNRFYCQILTAADYNKRFPVKTIKPIPIRSKVVGKIIVCNGTFYR